MTKAKAADVAKAIINQGIPCTVIPGPDDNSGWRISVRLNTTNNIDVATVNTFVTNQAIIGIITGVEFS